MAEIPCHAVKSPFEAAHQRGDRGEPCPELRARAAARNTSGLRVGSGRQAGGAAKRKSLQREENIFYWKPSKSRRAETGSAHTPGTRPAHWAICPLSTGWMAKATGSSQPLPKKAAKFLKDGTDTGASLLGGGFLKSVVAPGLLCHQPQCPHLETECLLLLAHLKQPSQRGPQLTKHFHVLSPNFQKAGGAEKSRPLFPIILQTSDNLPKAI